MTNRSAQPRARAGQTGQAAQTGVKKEEAVAGQPSQPQQRPHFYLTQQQLQTLQYLQNQPALSPQQQSLLQQLQHQFRLMQQHQQSMRMQAQQQQAIGIPRPVQPQTGQFSAQSANTPHSGSNIGSSTEIDGL